MHPSSGNGHSPRDCMNSRTMGHCQYRHERGHSIATLPPLAMHASATRTKDLQMCWKTSQCARILSCVSGPACQLMSCSEEPPMHGIDPNSKVGMFGWLTAARARAWPPTVVTSSSAVMRTTSQSSGASLPMRDSAPQQNSTMRRV